MSQLVGTKPVSGTLDKDMLSKTAKVLKNKYLKNKDIFDGKRAKLAKRNNELYPEFIKKQKELIRRKGQ